jgi:hypothetical protein
MIFRSIPRPREFGRGCVPNINTDATVSMAPNFSLLHWRIDAGATTTVDDRETMLLDVAAHNFKRLVSKHFVFLKTGQSLGIPEPTEGRDSGRASL